LALPGFAGSLMPRKWSCGSRFAACSAASTAAVCISVSAVPPDLEIATKRVDASGSCSSSGAERAGIEVVDEMQRGGSRKAPSAGTAWPASCASVWPPRLEPPVPRNTTSVVFRAAAAA
jgi:hypothetical protein